MKRLTARGHNPEYKWLGPPPEEATTLVFLHEGRGCVSTWRDFPARLAEATGCGALIYGRAGYGGSDPVTLSRPVSFMHDTRALKPHGLCFSSTTSLRAVVPIRWPLSFSNGYSPI